MTADKCWLECCGFTRGYPLTPRLEFLKQQSHSLIHTDAVALYLAKAAFSQNLVEDEVVHIDAGQMGNTGLGPWAGPLPQSAIGRSI